MQTEAAKESTSSPKRSWRDGWVIRGICSTSGQLLQVVSSFKTIGNKVDNSSIFGFAAANLVANAINILFGAQHKDDPHQLRYLKQKINAELTPMAQDGQTLPDVESHLSTPEQKNRPLQLLRRYSVTISEVGLRTVGAMSLIVPLGKWGHTCREVMRGASITQTFRAVRNTNKATFTTGLFALAGKVLTVASKEPDPFNPEPPSLWRQARERLMFRLSTISESIGALIMAHDRFANKRILIGGREHPDYYGGVGNLLFDAGYVARWIAPYGVREVNMSELYAHAARALQTLPPEKIAPMTDQISRELAEHFKAKGLQENDVRAEITRALNALPKSHIETGKQLHHSKPMAEQAAAQQL